MYNASGEHELIDISALSALTGVNTSTLRTWEARYSAFSPARGSGGRRFYTGHDVERIVLIRDLLRAGHRIASLATKSLDDLRAIDIPVPESIDQFDGALKARIEHAIQKDDTPEFVRCLRFAFGCFPPLVAVNLFAGTLRRIGELWAAGVLDVGREHILSAAARDVVRESIGRIPPSSTGRRMAFATLPDEWHECGLLAGCYLAAASGSSVSYFGPSMPVPDLAGNVVRHRIEVVVISSVYFADSALFRQRLAELDEGLPQDVAIWLCAQRNEETSAQRQRVSLVSTYRDFAQRLGLTA